MPSPSPSDSAMTGRYPRQRCRAQFPASGPGCLQTAPPTRCATSGTPPRSAQQRLRPVLPNSGKRQPLPRRAAPGRTRRQGPGPRPQVAGIGWAHAESGGGNPGAIARGGSANGAPWRGAPADERGRRPTETEAVQVLGSFELASCAHHRAGGGLLDRNPSLSDRVLGA